MKSFTKISSAMLVAISLLAAPSVAFAGGSASAKSGVFTKPIAGVRDNHWYDYRSDLEEAEIELGKDLADAKNYKDRRQAYAEYHHEVADARKDYLKEAREKGLVRGNVTVGG